MYTSIYFVNILTFSNKTWCKFSNTIYFCVIHINTLNFKPIEWVKYVKIQDIYTELKYPFIFPVEVFVGIKKQFGECMLEFESCAKTVSNLTDDQFWYIQDEDLVGDTNLVLIVIIRIYVIWSSNLHFQEDTRNENTQPLT